MSIGGNKEENQQEWENNPWAPAMGDLEKILGEVGNWYDNRPGDVPERDTSYLDGAKDFYDGILGGGKDITAGDITDAADQLWDSDLEQSMRDQSIRDMNATFAAGDVNAAAGGGMGSSRTALAQGAAGAQISNQLNQDLMGMRQDNLNTAQNLLTGNRDTQLQAGAGLIDSGRELSELDFLNETDRFNQGFDDIEKYLSIVGAIAGMGGSGSGSGSSSGSNWGLSYPL